MYRLITLLSLAAILPGCTPHCTEVSANDVTDPMPKSDSVAIKHLAAPPPPRTTNNQPDYFFAIAQYNTVYYGNSLENLAKLNIESAQLGISPDGKSIAYSSYDRPGHRVIKLIDIESKNQRVLDIPLTNVYMGSWNNAGKYIALNSQSTIYSHWQPVLFNVETNNITNIDWLDPDTDYYNPMFSPDGHKLVFHDIRRIYICNFRKGHAELERVIDTEDLCLDDNAGFSDYCKFQMSSDCKFLVFTIETDIFEEDICPIVALCCYNLQSGHLKRLTDKHTTVSDFALDSAGEIYFCTADKDRNIYEGYVARLDDALPIKSATFKEKTYAISVAE